MRMRNPRIASDGWIADPMNWNETTPRGTGKHNGHHGLFVDDFYLLIADSASKEQPDSLPPLFSESWRGLQPAERRVYESGHFGKGTS